MQKWMSGALLATLIAVSVTGCSVRPAEGENGEGQFSTTGDFVATLREKADALAKEELGRMAAVELSYRGKTEKYSMMDDFMGLEKNLYLKMYRNFTGSKVSDIYRSESYLHPVAIEIAYDFEMMGTEPRPAELPDGQAEALKDLRFKVLGEFTLIRRYKCDADGDYTGELPEMLQRPDYFRRETWAELKEPGSALPNMMPAGGAGMQAGQPMAPVMQRLPPPTLGEP